MGRGPEVHLNRPSLKVTTATSLEVSLLNFAALTLVLTQIGCPGLAWPGPAEGDNYSRQ